MGRSLCHRKYWGGSESDWGVGVALFEAAGSWWAPEALG